MVVDTLEGVRLTVRRARDLDGPRIAFEDGHGRQVAVVEWRAVCGSLRLLTVREGPSSLTLGPVALAQVRNGFRTLPVEQRRAAG